MRCLVLRCLGLIYHVKRLYAPVAVCYTWQTGLNANAYIRKLIMGESLRPRPPDGYAALLRELSALGSNVNQLARRANTRGEAAQAEISQAAELVREMRRLVKGWR